MKISAKGRYAVRIMTELVGHDDYVSVSDIAKSQDKSIKYTEQIVSILTRRDISNQKDFVDENDFDFILKLDKMSPEQAIKHLERRAQINAGYKQMIFWLLDLKELREIALIWCALDSLKQM